MKNSGITMPTNHTERLNPPTAVNLSSDVSGDGVLPATDLRARAFRESGYGWLALAIVWAACVGYMAMHIREGWIPSDAGMLGEEALRALRGQVPARDFVEVYTGGLTYLNALAFRLFGVNFFSLRIPLFLFFIGWVPTIYFIARRFAGPALAGAVTLLSVAWSVPNYPEGMPSWYNLFFATWGLLALVRYTENERKRWLWVAGICAGLSFLIKISGLYFVAAALLFFVYREQLLSRDNVGSPGLASLPYRVFTTCGLGAFVLVLTRLISQRPTAGEYFQFLLPSAALVAFLLWREWRQPRARGLLRFRRLFSMGAPFLAGALAPIALFLSWYAHEGAVRGWFEGTFVKGSLHTQWAGYDAVPLAGFLTLVPVLLAIIAALDSHASMQRLARYGSPVLLGALLLAAWKWFGFYVLLGCSPVFFVVLGALAAPACLRRSADISAWKRQQVFLVVAVTVVFSLIQFPYSMLLYFYYVAPLLALTILALWSVERRGEPFALGSVYGFYLAFALLLHTPAFFVAVGVPPYDPLDLRPMAIARAGGIRVPVKLAAEYEELVRLVRAHARGPYIYATPDCPQVYFLTGERNPTGTIYEFLSSDFLNPVGRQNRVMSDLEGHGVNLVVLAPANPQNSGHVPAGLLAALDARYPESARAGEFEVRWKP